MKKYLTLFIGIFIFSIQGFSQDVVVIPNQNQTSSTLKEVQQLPLLGTYQIVVDNIDLVVNISEATLNQINLNRHKKDVVYIVVSEYVKIKILPFDVIQAKTFKPIKQFSYEN